MRGDGKLERLCEGGRLQEPRQSQAAGGVCLEHVHRAGLQHAPEVSAVVSVFAGGDPHPVRRAIAQQSQPFQIIRRNRLLEPGGAEIGELGGESQRLLAFVRPVRVDEQVTRRTDRLARNLDAVAVNRGVRADLHLDGAEAGGRPPAQLLCQAVFEYEVNPPLP